MSQMVLILAVGPVQQFIGQARRMRDLWFGSHLLSEMSRAAARSLAVAGWTLVFPALSRGDRELEPCDRMTREESGAAPMGIANKIVATHENADDEMANESAANARKAVITRWESLADKAVARAGGLLATGLGSHESPQAVISSFLQLVAGWSSYSAEGDFERAREQAEQAVAARKTLRDFRPWHGGPYRKSSLDGQRESVLIDPQFGRMGKNADERPGDLATQFRIGEQEHLDGIGFVKRAAGKPDQFVPVARVVVEPWLKALDQAAARSPELDRCLKSLEAQCGQEELQRFQRGVTRWLRGGFPYDGEIFFEGQWPALEKELGLKDLCESYVQPLFRRPLSIPAPYPYVACLHADGDRMGKALRALATAERQSELSRVLAGFAGGMRDIVEDHSGLQVYAGGDDVLAILPVAHALDCAEALRAAFMARVRPLFERLPDWAQESLPTLSVGIGIGYFLTPLEKILDLAHKAERLAKQGEDLPDNDRRQRNALGVIFDKRSGGTLLWRCQWPDDRMAVAESSGPTPGDRLQRLIKLLSGRGMPGKLPYELGEVADAMAKEMQRSKDRVDRIAGRAWRLEVLRIVGRKRPEAIEAKLDPEAIHLELPPADDARIERVRDALAEWVGAAKIAVALADAEINRQRVERRGAALEKRDED